MKKILYSTTLALALFLSTRANALETYEYGFILSCGQTVYRTFLHQLTIDELLYWTDYYEYTVCGTIVPGVGDIIPEHP